LRYAHDRSAEMVGSFMFVFMFAMILLPNALLSKVVENAATLNSLEPPYVWENGSSAVTILRWQNPLSCPSSSVWGFVPRGYPCALLFPCKFLSGVRRVWHSDLPVSNSFRLCGLCGQTAPGDVRTMRMMVCCCCVFACCTSIVCPCDQNALSRVVCIFGTLVDFVASVFCSVHHFLFGSRARLRSPSSAALFPL
jgi:hypothetical protein